MAPRQHPLIMPTHPFDGVVHAPEFPTHLDWLNTDRPISIADLRGKIVLLDFWTSCCINCMHVLPELKRLEQKYADELIVIGVHSAKFTTEKDTDAICQAILRYEISHPVVNDRDFQIWKEYGIHAWPSFMLINPTGRVVGSHSGEGIFPLFDPLIQNLINHFSQKGELKRTSLRFQRESNDNTDGPHSPAPSPVSGRRGVQEVPSTLSFPGKIHASENHLFIADTNHNRILITDLNGRIQDTIGSGIQGRTDGPFQSATFHHPQGIHRYNNHLYIADTENHLIREADLSTRTVHTVLGTGEQAPQFNQPGTGTRCALNSPWDLLVLNDILYIAMAGAHQIWRVDPTGWHARPHAGSAREDIEDGALLSAVLAQPSGLTTDGKRLLFADSETSAIRTADITPNGRVRTLIGTGLFHFGDTDGAYPNARLQHPIGITHHNGTLYISDTYNSKIKIIDSIKKTATTFTGIGTKGTQDGPLLQSQFNEPAGITASDNRLYIADTNNHAIRIIDLNTQTVSTLNIR